MEPKETQVDAGVEPVASPQSTRDDTCPDGSWAGPIGAAKPAAGTTPKHANFIRDLEKRHMSDWSNDELARYNRLTGQLLSERDGVVRKAAIDECVAKLIETADAAKDSDNRVLIKALAYSVMALKEEQ